MKSITLAIPTMAGGGTERAILLLANFWAREGITVDLLLFRKTGPLLKNLHKSIRIHSLDSTNPLSRLIRLVRFFNTEKPSHVLSALNETNTLVAIAARISRYRPKTIATVHNHLGAKYKHNPSFLNPIRKKLIGWALRNSNGVVTVSKSIKEFLISELNTPASAIKVIYNPIETKEHEKRASPHPWLEKNDGPLLIAAGRLTRQKNFSLLLDAMLLLPDSVRLAIIGEGEDRKSLEVRIQELGIKERVLLPGFQSQPEQWFQRASCYVMSSDWEGFPFVLLEALSTGLQTVSTNCPSGPDELLEGGKYGRLVPCGDPKKMAEAIQKTLDSPLPRETLTRRASEFAIDKVASRYAEWITEVSESHD